MKINEKTIGDLKDIIWFLKGFNNSEITPFNSEHIDSLLEAIIYLEREVQELHSVND